MSHSSGISYTNVWSWLKGTYPGLRKTTITYLALLVYGILSSQTLFLAEIARAFPIEALCRKHKHQLKRVGRALSTPFLTARQVFPALMRWAVAQAAQYSRVLVLIDYTTLGDRFTILWAAVNWRGRALPIYCFALLPHKITTSQNRIEEAFIRRVWQLLPTGYGYVLVADRGFGRASLIQWLQKEHISYIIRLNSNVYVTHCGRKRLLKDYHLHCGEGHLYQRVAYREDEVVTINLVLTWLMLSDNKPDEPWFLATDLTSFEQAVDGYFARMQIEEFFRDDKHHLHWEEGGPGTVQRQQRLCLALSCAYLICAALGTQPEVEAGAERLFRKRSAHEKQQAPRWSRILLALKAIRHPHYFPPVVFERVFRVLTLACASPAQQTGPPSSIFFLICKAIWC